MLINHRICYISCLCDVGCINNFICLDVAGFPVVYNSYVHWKKAI